MDDTDLVLQKAMHRRGVLAAVAKTEDLSS